MSRWDSTVEEARKIAPDPCAAECDCTPRQLHARWVLAIVVGHERCHDPKYGGHGWVHNLLDSLCQTFQAGGMPPCEEGEPRTFTPVYQCKVALCTNTIDPGMIVCTAHENRRCPVVIDPGYMPHRRCRNMARPGKKCWLHRYRD